MRAVEITIFICSVIHSVLSLFHVIHSVLSLFHVIHSVLSLFHVIHSVLSLFHVIHSVLSLFHVIHSVLSLFHDIHSQSVSEDQVCGGMEWSLGESIMKAMSQHGLTLFDIDNPSNDRYWCVCIEQTLVPRLSSLAILSLNDLSTHSQLFKFLCKGKVKGQCE